MDQHKPARSVMQKLGDWYVVMEWPPGVDDGGPARLVIEPIGEDQPVGGLSSTVLRQIDFRGAIQKLRNEVERDQARSNEHEAVDRWRADRLRRYLAEGAASDQYLALLASEYVRAVVRGQVKVNEYLAEMVGKPLSTIRGHLWQARKQGLLSASPGRKGGQLSDEANAIVEQIEEESSASFLEALERARREL